MNFASFEVFLGLPHQIYEWLTGIAHATTTQSLLCYLIAVRMKLEVQPKQKATKNAADPDETPPFLNLNALKHFEVGTGASEEENRRFLSTRRQITLCSLPVGPRQAAGIKTDTK